MKLSFVSRISGRDYTIVECIMLIDYRSAEGCLVNTWVVHYMRGKTISPPSEYAIYDTRSCDRVRILVLQRA